MQHQLWKALSAKNTVAISILPGRQYFFQSDLPLISLLRTRGVGGRVTWFFRSSCKPKKEFVNLDVIFCSLVWRKQVTLIRREKVMHHILIFPPLGPHSKWPQPSLKANRAQWQKVISINPVYLSTSTQACKSSSYYEFCIQFCRGSPASRYVINVKARK